LMLGEIANELPRLFQLWARKGLMQAWQLIENILEAGRKSGEFHPETDSKSIARFLHAGLSHQAFLQIHMGLGTWDRISPDRIRSGSLNLVIRGLRNPAARRSGT